MRSLIPGIRAIHGVGVDVADTIRIERLVRTYGDRFTRRWFSDLERSECGLAADLAGREYSLRLAAKEAVWKALRLDGTHRAVPWKNIAVLADERPGLARISLAGDLEEEASRLRVCQISASFSMYGTVSVATAIVEVMRARLR